MAAEFDLFLSHNNEDKSAVREIADGLKRRRFKPWLDVENLTPAGSGRTRLAKLRESTRAVLQASRRPTSAAKRRNPSRRVVRKAWTLERSKSA